MDDMPPAWSIIMSGNRTHTHADSLLELLHMELLMHGERAVAILAIVIAVPCTFILFLVLAGVTNQTLVDQLPMRHGAGFMALLLVAMLSGQSYLMGCAAAVLFGAGVHTCPTLTVLLTWHYAFALYPVLGQLWMLWRTLHRRDLHIGDDQQRILWRPSAYAIAYTLAFVLVSVSAVYLALSGNRPGGHPMCRSHFGGFDIAFFTAPSGGSAGGLDDDQSLLTSQLIMWLLAWVPVPLVALLVLRLSRSRFIPLYGARWTKLSRLWVALVLSIVFSFFSSLQVHCTYRSHSHAALQHEPHSARRLAILST